MACSPSLKSVLSFSRPRALRAGVAVLAFAAVAASAAAIVPNDVRDYGAFREVPLTAIHPRGWLRDYLEEQASGLTGHLEAAGYPFNTNGWDGPEITNNTSIEDWWPYEQNAYWVDGMERCGLLLRDDALLAKAGRQIDYVLQHPAPNGYLGPLFGGESTSVNRWIHVVFFRALMAAYADGKHDDIPERLRRHYLAGDSDYAGVRDSINIEGMLWCYAHTGEARLLRLAERTYRLAEKANQGTPTSATSLLTDKPANEHGVTYDERAKLGALLYRYTGNRDYLAPSVAAFRKLDRYHMLVAGVNVSSEYLQLVRTTEAYETCDISDYTWSAGYLFEATGDPGYADRIERAVFNAAPGSVAHAFHALQYFGSPNQVVCTQTSFPRSGGSQMSYAPNPGTECCPGNVTRCVPNFAARLWMQGGPRSIAAVMFSPCSFDARSVLGEPVTIDEVTEYPFGNDVAFHVHTPAPSTFTLQLRIPGWADSAEIRVNGRAANLACRPGTFAAVGRTFRDGDVVELHLGARLKLEAGPSGTTSVVRGPLVFSLAVPEVWRRVVVPGKSTPEFPAYDLTAGGPWNYALEVENGQLAQVDEERRPVGRHPWNLDGTPVELRVRARQVTDWKIHPQRDVVTERWDVRRDPKTHKVTRWFLAGYDHRTGDFQFTPEVPAPSDVATHLASTAETVRLVPYGCAKLRITYFPIDPVHP